MISYIEFINFRNISNLKLELNPLTNLFIGENGQGKTNLLEGLYFLCNGRAINNKKNDYIINFEKKTAIIKARADNKNFKVVINKDNKSIYVNDKLIEKVSDYIGIINSVLLIPKDIEIIDGQPKTRRKFIDEEISKISIDYVDDLKNYYKLLKERNILLRNQVRDYVMYEVIDRIIIDLQVSIYKKRKEFIELLSKEVKNYYHQFYDIDIEIVYDSIFKNDNEKIKELYKNEFEKDILYKRTSLGIQIEDIEFKSNSVNAAYTLSQGQKRILLICLKLANVNIIKKASEKSPLLLFDDILAELDEDNKNKIIELIPKETQVVITATSKINQIKNCKIHTIENGNIKEEIYDK